MPVLELLNYLLRPLGVLVVPRPPSGNALREIANVAETHHPARGGRAVRWLRIVAKLER